MINHNKVINISVKDFRFIKYFFLKLINKRIKGIVKINMSDDFNIKQKILKNEILISTLKLKFSLKFFFNSKELISKKYKWAIVSFPNSEYLLYPYKI